MSNKIHLSLTIGILLALVSGEVLAAKRTFKECWTTCYHQTCSTLAKQYQEEKLWNEVEECQERCKADCQVFEDRKADAAIPAATAPAASK
jgi:hypothetical protein